jgi:branched-chain amino acid transport system permease protein
MEKRIRRSLRNAGAATLNFGKWLPKASKHFFEEMPPATRRFKSWAATFRGGLAILCLVGVTLFPLLSSNEYLLGIFVTANIWVIYAASWDFLAGFVGQTSFGHAAFLGIAGYFSAGLAQGIGVKWGQPWWVSVFIGAIMAVLFGLIVGIPCLRLRGPYLALGTLAFTLILTDMFQSSFLATWLHGSEGVSGLPPLSYNPVVEYLVILAFMVLSVVIMIAIVKSRIGTVFRSIRDDETSAEAAGINTTKYKLLAFMISAFFAGIAGSLYALHSRAVSPPAFSTLYSFYAIIIAAMGGIATIFGSIGGAYLFTFVSQALTGFLEISMLIFAVLLIIVFRFASAGYVNPLVERLKEFVQVLRGK